MLTLMFCMVLHLHCISLRHCKFPIDIYLDETNIQMKDLGAESICAINC